MKERKSREEWIRLCTGFEVSGMSEKAYAEKEGVNGWTLKYHLSRLRKSGVIGPGNGFSQVKIMCEKSSQAKPYCKIEFEGVGRIVIESESGLMMLKQLLTRAV